MHDYDNITFYIITKSISYDQFTVPVNSWKNCASSELLYKGNRPQVSMVYRHDKPLGMLKEFINHLLEEFINHSPAARYKFTNSSRVLPTSRMVYQPIKQRNLWSIA